MGCKGLGRRVLSRIAIIIAAATLWSVPALAKDQDENAQKDKLVCRSELILGSRIPKRTCMTREQWDQQARDSQEQMARNRADARILVRP